MQSASGRTRKRFPQRCSDGNAVGFCSDFVVESALPQGLTMAEDGPLGICVSFSGRDEPFLRTLHLVPRIVTLGVGCRKDVAPEVFEEAILALLSQNDLSVQAVREVATIDLKAREPCILAFCEKYRLPLCTASAGTLGALEGSFSGSAFVKGAVGVDNVCERAAGAHFGREPADAQTEQECCHSRGGRGKLEGTFWTYG